MSTIATVPVIATTSKLGSWNVDDDDYDASNLALSGQNDPTTLYLLCEYLET